MNIDKKQTVKLISYMATFDGGIYYPSQKNSNAFFMMNMKEENRDYLEWVNSVVNTITSCSINHRPDYNTDGFSRKPQLTVRSNRHPFLTKIRERLYINNHKVLDPHMLKLMDAEALAIIFMADGGSSLDCRFKNPHCSITLNTKGFSYNDNMALSKTIHKVFGIRSTVRKHKKYFYLGIKTADIVLFLDTIQPHILPSFYYKFERIAPAVKSKLGGDIVWPAWKHAEIVRDELSHGESHE